MYQIVLLLILLFIALQFTKNKSNEFFMGIPEDFSVENFRANEQCGNSSGNGGVHKPAHNLCYDMAKFNCRAPTWTNNDCWTNTYQKCMGDCHAGPRGAGNACNCHAVASDKCVSNNAPANACFNSTYQKCLAGMFENVEDPDRRT